MNRNSSDKSVNSHSNPLYYAIKELMLQRGDYASATLKSQSDSTSYYDVTTKRSNRVFTIAVKKNESGKEFCMVDLPGVKGISIEVEGENYQIVEFHLSFYEKFRNQYWLSPMHMTLSLVKQTWQTEDDTKDKQEQEQTLSIESEAERTQQKTVHLYFDSCGKYLKTCQQEARAQEETSEREEATYRREIVDRTTQQTLLSLYQEHTTSFTDFLFLETISTEINHVEKQITSITKQLEELSKENLDSVKYLKDYVDMRETLMILTEHRYKIEYRPDISNITKKSFHLAKYCYNTCVKKLKDMESREKQSSPSISIDKTTIVQENMGEDPAEFKEETTSEEADESSVINLLERAEKIKKDKSLIPPEKADKLFTINQELLALLDSKGRMSKAIPFMTLMKLQKAMLDNNSLIINQLFHAIFERKDKWLSKILSTLSHIPFECLYAISVIILINLNVSSKEHDKSCDAELLQKYPNLSKNQIFEKVVGLTLPEAAIINKLEMYFKVPKRMDWIVDCFHPKNKKQAVEEFIPHVLLRALDFDDKKLAKKLLEYTEEVVKNTKKKILRSALIQACITLRVKSLVALQDTYKLSKFLYTVALGQLCRQTFSNPDEQAQAQRIAKQLIEWGADFTQNMVSYTRSVVDKSESEKTAHEQDSCVQSLPRVYLTALQTACLCGNLPLVELLVERGDRIFGRNFITQQVNVHRALSSSILNESKPEEPARAPCSRVQSQKGCEERHTAVFFAHLCRDEEQRESIINYLKNNVSEKKVFQVAKEKMEQSSSPWKEARLQATEQIPNRPWLWSPFGASQNSMAQRTPQKPAEHSQRSLTSG